MHGGSDERRIVKRSPDRVRTTTLGVSRCGRPRVYGGRRQEAVLVDLDDRYDRRTASAVAGGMIVVAIDHADTFGKHELRRRSRMPACDTDHHERVSGYRHGGVIV